MHVVVVGAGILGASVAFHLAREGVQVTIVDQAHDGRATAAGAGIICPWVSGVEDPAFYRLYVGGGRYYGDLIPASGGARRNRSRVPSGWRDGGVERCR